MRLQEAFACVQKPYKCRPGSVSYRDYPANFSSAKFVHLDGRHNFSSGDDFLALACSEFSSYSEVWIADGAVRELAPSLACERAGEMLKNELSRNHGVFSHSSSGRGFVVQSWPSLVSLILCEVTISASDLHSLLLACPKLESFTLQSPNTIRRSTLTLSPAPL